MHVHRDYNVQRGQHCRTIVWRMPWSFLASAWRRAWPHLAVRALSAENPDPVTRKVPRPWSTFVLLPTHAGSDTGCMCSDLTHGVLSTTCTVILLPALAPSTAQSMCKAMLAPHLTLPAARRPSGRVRRGVLSLWGGSVLQGPRRGGCVWGQPPGCSGEA